MAKFTVLSPEILKGFDKYKYSAIDTSPLSIYVTHPFWNWFVQFYPLWLAPNVLTLVGFLQLVVNFALLTWYDFHFYAASRDYPDYPPVPNWVWLVCGINNFVAHTLDGTDGKQARRTGTSGPLGELFDHGLDSWATLFLPLGMYSIFGRGEMSVDSFRVFLVVLGTMLCFIMSHWEKYNTGVLFLPWGYDIAQIAMSVVYVITFFGGHDMWKFHVPLLGWTAAEGFEVICYAGFVGLTFPPSLWNVYKSYRDKTGKMRSLGESIRPLVSTFLLFVLMLFWAKMSSYDILEKQTKLFYVTSGTTFSNIACHLIIAQMSNTRCELINRLLIPLFSIVTVIYFLNLGVLELYMLCGYCAFVTASHIYFGVSVVKEMCEHFKIRPFSIPKSKKSQ